MFVQDKREKFIAKSAAIIPDKDFAEWMDVFSIEVKCKLRVLNKPRLNTLLTQR